MIRLFKDAEIAAAGRQGLERGDVLVEDGKISKVGVGIEVPAGAETIDCSGKILLPGNVRPSRPPARTRPER